MEPRLRQQPDDWEPQAVSDEPETIEGVHGHCDVGEAGSLRGRQIDGIAAVVVGEPCDGDTGEGQQEVVGHVVDFARGTNKLVHRANNYTSTERKAKMSCESTQQPRDANTIMRSDRHTERESLGSRFDSALARAGPCRL